MQEDVTRPVVGGHEAERLLLVEPQDGAVGAVTGRDQGALRTPASKLSGTRCWACGPFSPAMTTKATRCPAARTPPVTMAEECTNTSAPPPSGAANP